MDLFTLIGSDFTISYSRCMHAILQVITLVMQLYFTGEFFSETQKRFLDIIEIK